MITEEEIKANEPVYVGLSGELVSLDADGNAMVIGRVEMGNVTFGNVMRVTHAYPKP